MTLPVYTASSVFPCRGGVWRKSELCWVCIWHRGRTLWPKCWRDADSGESSWCRRSPRDTANCISSGCGIFQILGEEREKSDKILNSNPFVELNSNDVRILHLLNTWTIDKCTSTKLLCISRTRAFPTWAPEVRNPAWSTHTSPGHDQYVFGFGNFFCDIRHTLVAACRAEVEVPFIDPQ